MKKVRSSTASEGDHEPLVSVIIAAFNAVEHIEAAIRSALDQTLADIEIVVVDDASIDESLTVANRLASDDPRVRVMALAVNAGPAVARNAAIASARGKWIAVLDSDDRFHPDRLRMLILQAEMHEADIVADDLMVFESNDAAQRHRFLRGRYPSSRKITLDAYLDATVMFGSHPDLGYLKPIFRSKLLRAAQGYDERLRVGEDDDLIVRLLLDGAHYLLVPNPTYFYRKHDQSISHRLDSHQLRAMIDRAESQRMAVGGASRGIRQKLAHRIRARRRALKFTTLVENLKRGDAGASFAAAFARPSPLLLLRLPLMARLDRLTMAVRHRLSERVDRRDRTASDLVKGARRPIHYHARANAAEMLGLIWLLDTVWPIVLRAMPDATLIVSGTIARHFLAKHLNGVLSDTFGAPPAGGAIRIMPDRIATLNGSDWRTCSLDGSIMVATSDAGLSAGDAQPHIIADEAETFAAALIALASNVRPHPDSPSLSRGRRDPGGYHDGPRKQGAAYG